MIKRSSKIFLIICLRLIAFNILSAQIISPFNRLEIKDSSLDYSFVVSGHFHGASTNISSFPASSILSSIDTLNSLNPISLFTLGDIFLDVNKSTINHYQKSLFEKLKMPIFNAVGNHDLSNGNLYERVYGKTYFSFTHCSEMFIVLNTELNDGSIKNEQFEFLKTTLNTLSSNRIKNIFIFSHRPIWAENIKKYSKLFNDNTRSVMGSNSFSNDIIPLLKKASKNKNVFWISGSMGGMAPVSFFYDKDEETNVTFMQTAIRDLPRDAVLLVNVNQGNISFKGISLTGQQLEPIENYNIGYWNKTSAPEQKFSFRLLPYLTKQMLVHHYFWIGFASATFLLLLFSFIKIRWKKNK